ncbi:MAG: HAMP domain-containing histidine kinase [Alphaproteobacteria bacterium]|nr:HAMP domain-containing histidine kinase [Alphaproteobacteria bacterium]
MDDARDARWIQVFLALCAVGILVTGFASWTRPMTYNPMLPRVAIMALGLGVSLAPELSSWAARHLRDLFWSWGVVATAVRGYAELIEDAVADGDVEDVPRDLERIRRASDHLLGLIDQILDLTRIERGELDLTVGRVDVGDVVRAAVARVPSDRLALDVPAGLVARADADRLGQIVGHLVDNALKFAPDGTVTVSGTAGERVTLTVTDEGPGVPEADRTRIFEPFVMGDASSTRARTGAGLGLALARDLALLMGGDLQLEPDGPGARFTVTLTAA